MDDSRSTLERAAGLLGYLLVGLLATAAVALALLSALRPLQPLVYGAVYLQVGPSEATETAVLTHFVTAGLLAVGVAMLLGDYLSDRLAHARPLAAAVGGLAGLIAAFLAVSLAGYAAFLTALLVLAAALVGVPLLVRYRYGVRSGGVPAFLGGVPVLVVLLLLVGFGLGWGWGYVVTAREVPDSQVGDDPVATFDDVPAVRDDLFAAGDCETDVDGRRVCRLFLRGYEHETAAARFMARNGVRCPYGNARAAAPAESFLARHDGTVYRVACAAHGD